MTLIQVPQISFESEVCGLKWRHVYNKTVNIYDIVTDMELIFGQLITHDNMTLRRYADFVTMATVVNSRNYVT